MSVASRSGHLYSMNVIDDYTSYVWSLPLRHKSDAIVVLQGWHAAVQNQSGHRLTYLITDNGELSSHSMTDFCSQNGITHLFTAPYTSAHNGRAERLHRTLHEKARTMRIACNVPAVPPSMWDEFCATAAFLINLSACSSLHGRTPYERWFNRLPSLSHLLTLSSIHTTQNLILGLSLV
jgi:transposase InsO family protein